MRISDWSSDVCSSDLRDTLLRVRTATFDNLFEAVGVFASDGRLHLWNNRFRKIWGFEEEMLAGHPRVDQLMERAAHKLSKPKKVSAIREFGRASCREREGQSVYTAVVAVSEKKKGNE